MKDIMASLSNSTRQHDARVAGQAIYGAMNGDDQSFTATNSNQNSITMPQTISAIRRTFLLLVLFDLLISVILWLIYTQLKAAESTVKKAYQDQVTAYTFNTSLFDTVWLSAFRFAILTLAYALVRANKPWWVAITTTGTCAFIIAKVVKYEDFDKNKTLATVVILDYIIIITSVVIAWTETWLLDLKVLPHEKKERLRSLASLEAHHPNENSPLLARIMRHNLQDESFYSPVHSQSESRAESVSGDSDDSRPFHTVTHSRSQSIASLSLDSQEYEYVKLINNSLREAWSLAESADWRVQKGESEETGIVYSLSTSKYGKIFKLVAELEVNALTLYNDMVENVGDIPKWNPTVLEVKTLQTINENTEIGYSVAAEGAGGMVSSRDFVYIRYWEQRNGWYVTASISTDYPGMPEQSKYVRGVQRPGLIRLRDISGGRTSIEWVLNSDLKGWLPQYLIDQALSSVLLSYAENLRKHCATLG